MVPCHTYPQVLTLVPDPFLNSVRHLFSVLCSRLLLNYGTASLCIQPLMTHYSTIKLVMQGKTFLCFLCGHEHNLNCSKGGKFGRKEVRHSITGLSELF